MEFKFIFLDESFIDQNHHPNVSLMFYDETGCPVGVGKPAKGCRLCFIDAICDLGPVPGAWRVLKPRRRGAALEAAKRGSPQDYHDMFNGIFFKEWFMGVLNTLLEWQMDRKWVIVLDRAQYHIMESENEAISSSSKRASMVSWIVRHGVPLLDGDCLDATRGCCPWSCSFETVSLTLRSQVHLALSTRLTSGASM